jgi:hypothetical protein
MQNSRYAADFNTLYAFCRQRDVAIQTIKSICRRPWGERERTRATWYEPLEDQKDINMAVSWVLARPGVFLNTIGDIHILPRVLKAARDCQEAPTDEVMQQVAERLQVAPLFV